MPLSSLPPSADDGLADVPPVVGAYRVRKAIAAGGMAGVFLATQVEPPHGIVALKRVHPHLMREQGFVDMFHDEALIASQIEHPNVCRVLDFGTDRMGVPYMAMDYLVGEPLTGMLRGLVERPELAAEPRWPAFAARIVAESALGLHAAHELRDGNGELRRVVHRDVSPQNLFVGFDGVVKVVDFGIASATHRIHQTRTGQLKGKFGYMAPENVRGSGAIDRRADVWALGVVLWEALTLKRLFRRRSDVETLGAVLEGPIPRPSELAPGLPSSLDAIVMTALERDLDHRFATAEELARALASWLWDVRASVGTSDLASWMLRCFPTGPAASAAMLRALDEGLAIAGPARNEAVDDGATVITEPPTMPPEPVFTLPKEPQPVAPPIPAPEMQPPEPPLRPKKTKWIVASVVVLVLVASAIAIAVGMRFASLL